jgi:serine/threonine-protein kinase RsbW
MYFASDAAVNRCYADDGKLMDETIQVRIPGSTAYIRVVRDAVDALADRVALSLEDRAAIKLAVGEACNNAVQHAPSNADACSRMVAVALRIRPDALEIDVTNEGNDFHPAAHANMPTAELLSERGRGLALIELMMDSVEYLHHDGNTVVRMRKRHHHRVPPKILAD